MTIGVRYENGTGNLNGAADSDGDMFVISDIEGMDSMDTDLQVTPHHRDGLVYSKGRYPKRELLVKGIGYAPGSTTNGVLRIRQKIENMFADYGWQKRWLYVDIPSPGTNVQFKTLPGGKIHFDPPVGNSQTFEVPFTCPDPRKYAQALQIATVSGSATLTNFGNFPTFVTASLTNDSTDPYIQNNTTGNQAITLSGAIPAGSWIDFSARKTYRAGVGFQEMALRPRIWWQLLPGNNTITSNAVWNVTFNAAYR